ncbi:hypothetical protein ABPG72_020491, partial [Tetrahymena utriculariae]
YNKIYGIEASNFLANLIALTELTTLRLYILDYLNFIEDTFYYSVAESIPKFVKLNTLRLGFMSYDKFLKSSDFINCRNVKILKLWVESEDLQKIAKNKRLAQKIKRLVKLNVDSIYF